MPSAENRTHRVYLHRIGIQEPASKSSPFSILNGELFVAPPQLVFVTAAPAWRAIFPMNA
jgi:hypothetical protein